MGITTTYAGTTNKTRQPSKELISSTPWNFGNLGFNEENAMSINDLIITFEFKITNYSNFAIEASVTVPSISGIVIEKEDLSFSYSYDSVAGADIRNITVILKPASLETPVSLTNLNISLNISKTLRKETDVSKFNWGTPNAGTISITGNSFIPTDSEIVIPKMYGANEITTIGSKAFMECNSLEKITIPDTVTSIENGFYEVREHGAFLGCSSLKSVSLPDSLTEIGDYAFYGCRNLSNINFSNGMERIGSCAFDSCIALTNVTFPDSLTSIGYSAFWGCSKLTIITIPKSVTSIVDGAFRSCSALSAINVDEANATYSSEEGVLFNKNKTTVIQCPGAKTSYIVPNSITSIAERAFLGCYKLTSVKILNSVISIGYQAFAYCEALISVTIPNSVASIDYSAFSFCSALTSVYFERISIFTSLGSNCFSGLKSGSVLYFKNQIVCDQIVAGTHYTEVYTTKALY